jgi:glycosyltransferase involved in cell wall biosynthesis
VRIAFICHPTGEHWSPASVASGIGGSEEAVIQLAPRLASRGHEVSVHMRMAPTGDFGGVRYTDMWSLAGEEADVAVVWRRPGLTDRMEQLSFRPRRTYLWLHDNIGEDTVARYEHRFHKVMVLSAVHRGRYPSLADDRFLVTSNGIDPADCERIDVRRDPYQLVYGSDYGRGLRGLLQAWPAVRRAEPRARLNVFYGWQGVQRRSPQRARRLQREFAPLLSQAGVTHLGRIGHRAVADQYARASVWAYPCSFAESRSISAMKAQSAGAVPAVIPTGALKETVRFGFRTTRCYDDGIPERELLRDWRDGLIDLLLSPERRSAIREEMIPVSRRQFDWWRVAEEWDAEFSSAE